MNINNNLRLILFAILVSILIFFATIFIKGKRAGEVVELPADISIAEPTVFVPVTPFAQEDGNDDLIGEFNNSPRVPYDYILSNGEKYTIEIPIGFDPPPLAVVERMREMEKQ